MKRGVVFKNINQQLTAHNRIHLNTGALILRQRRIFLDYNESSRLYPGHGHSSLDQLIHCLVTETLLDILKTVKRHEIRQQLLFSRSSG